MPTYFETRCESGLEPYVGVVMQPAKDVVLDFGNGTYRKMVAYDDGIFIDVSVMMESLKTFLKGKVKFQKRQINSFVEISTKYIINCSGIGAKKLVNDNSIISVQGHLIMLKEQVFENLQYMILVYLDSCKNKHGQKVTRSFYMFPKRPRMQA